MAAVLQKLLSDEVSVDQIVEWLMHEGDCKALNSLDNVKAEFVPYFLNFLRDQTLHLLQGCKSTGTTPAKTPTTAKLKRLSAFGANTSTGDGEAKTSTPQSTSQQLFGSPMNNADISKGDSTFDASFVTHQASGGSFNKSGSAPRKQNTSRSYGHQGSGDQGGGSASGKSHRSIQFNTPEFQRRKDKHSLSDFLVSPDIDNRSRLSPHGNHRGRTQDGSPSPHMVRRSGGRNRRPSGDKKSGKPPQEKSSVSRAFSLNDAEDFPPVGLTLARKMHGALPEGAKVLTPSRRITPLLLGAAEADCADDSAVFKNSPILDSAESMATPKMAWGKRMCATDPPSGGGPDKMSNSRSGRKKDKPSRRITPTVCAGADTARDNLIFTMAPIRAKVQPAPQVDHSTDPASTPKAEVSIEGGLDLDQEAEDILPPPLTAKTPSKQSQVGGGGLLLTGATPTKLGMERLISTDLSPADRGQVTMEIELTRLARLYSLAIEHFLVANVTLELYFVLQLLTARGGELDSFNDISTELDEIHYFAHVHNAVFFAVTVLEQLTSLLSQLDRGTLRLLIDNQRVTDFGPALREKLTSLCDTMMSKPISTSLPSPVGGVSFQADTDNRKNFPSDRVFHIFKKQRDQFYELLREWEEHHLDSGWSMADVQGVKVRQLVSFRTELANHIHFARLFYSQLLQMCKGDSGFQREGEEEQAALITQLKQTNPGKLKRLHGRLVNPSHHGGPCPAPSFLGCQEFFKDFIVAASNHVFNQHLIDILAMKIDELDDMQIVTMDMGYEEGEDVLIDVEDREALANNIVTSKLLGKFLGFVIFLPYQSPERLPEALMTAYIATRNKTLLPLDLVGRVGRAVEGGRTVLTVPWVVELLTMMDPLAPHLDCFATLFTLLLDLFRMATWAFVKAPSHSLLLVTTVLGRLFELNLYPVTKFYKMACVRSAPERPVTSHHALDNLNIVDQPMLYACCPFLGEVRNVLVDFAVGYSSRLNSIRKITPVAALDSDTTVSTTLTEKQLQQQLEENFFHNQPSSLRRTVDFVADRVTSNHIKRFRAVSLPAIMSRVPDLTAALARDVVAGAHSPSRVSERQLLLTVEKAAHELTQEARALGLKEAPSYCRDKAEDALDILLAEETTKAVLAMAGHATYHVTLDKVVKWLNTHITTNIFKRELTSELDKRVRLLSRTPTDGATGALDAASDKADADKADADKADADKADADKADADSRGGADDTLTGRMNKLTMDGDIARDYTSEADVKASKMSLSTSATSASQFEKLVHASVSLVASGNAANLNLCQGCLRHRQSDPDLTPSGRDAEKPSRDVVESSDDVSDKLCCATDMTSSVSQGMVAHPVSTPDDAGAVGVMTLCPDCRRLGRVQFPAPAPSDSRFNDKAVIKPDRDPKYVIPSETGTRSVRQSHPPERVKVVNDTARNISSAPTAGSDDVTTAMAGDVSGVPPSRGLVAASVSVAMETKAERRSPEPASADSGVHTCTVKAFCPGYVSPTDTLVSIKELVKAVILQPESVTSERVLLVLTTTETALRQETEIVPFVVKMVAKLSVKLSFLLAIEKPRLMTDDVHSQLCALWTRPEVRAVAKFNGSLCPKHLYTLAGSGDGQLSMTKFLQLMTDLLALKLVTWSLVVSGAYSVLKNGRCESYLPLLADVMCALIEKESLQDGTLEASARQNLHKLLTSLHASLGERHVRLQDCILRVSRLEVKDAP